MRTTVALTGCLAAMLFAGPAGAQGRGGGRGIPIQAGEQCPPGMTEIRPRSCLAPEFPPPSIVDYRPKATLVVPANMRATAKYPAIDYHGHPQGRLNSAETIEALGAALDSLNVRVMVAADNISGTRLKNVMALVNASPTMK